MKNKERIQQLEHQLEDLAARVKNNEETAVSFMRYVKRISRLMKPKKRWWHFGRNTNPQ